MPLFIVGFILLVGLLIYAVYYYFIQAPSDSDPRMRKPAPKTSKTSSEEPEQKVIYFPSRYAQAEPEATAKDSVPEENNEPESTKDE